MGDVRVKELPSVEIARIDNIAPVTIAALQQIDKIAPVAVHIKELNQVEPLQVESLRVDRVSNIDPLLVDRVNVTRLPVVNLSVNQVPGVDVTIRRLPPVSIGIHQMFEMPSHYTAKARFLGFEFLTLQLDGCTRVVPRDIVHREQSHVHERSFPDVAPVGNPSIPTIRQERSAVAMICPPPPRRPAVLSGGPPRFSFSAPRRPAERIAPRPLDRPGVWWGS